MSTLNSIEIRIVDHMVCEIEAIKMGEIACANKMLIERIEAMNRLFSLECLIDFDDSEYDSLITYIFEQLKEMTTKLNISI